MHIDRRTIAKVASRYLAEPEKYLDKIYLLTSDKAVNYYDVAEVINKVINGKVKYVPI